MSDSTPTPPFFDGTVHSFRRTQSYIGAVESAVFQLEDAALLINALHPSRAYRASILQLLSSGFEHMMKVILIAGHEEQGLGAPNVRKLSHDLIKLRNAVLEFCERVDYADRPQLQADLEYLRSDRRFNFLLHLISNYGQSARYFNIDGLTKDNAGEEWRPPEFIFQEIKDEIVGDDPRFAINLNGGNDWSWMYPLMRDELLFTVQRAAAAFCRMFVHDLLKQTGKTMMAVVLPLARLDDDELRTLVASARIDDLTTRL